MGESRADTKKRAGLLINGSGWAYSCFNCGFKTKFVNGQSVTKKTRTLLGWFGLDRLKINRICLDNFTQANSLSDYKPFIPTFKKVVLPNSREITEKDTWATEYLSSRGLNYDDYIYMITPDESGRNKSQIIIPCTNNGTIVGYVSSYADRRTPKYINHDIQPGYIFGLDMQPEHWKYIIAVEGIYDALSIGGVSIFGNNLNENKQTFLRQQNKEVIVVPDQDRAGMQVVETALNAGFYVSIPHWPDDIKDVNDAVLKYSKLGVILQIITSKTRNVARVKLAMRQLGKKITK